VPIANKLPSLTAGRDGRPATASRTADRDRHPAAGVPA